MFDLARYMQEKRVRVDAALDRHLPAETEPPALLHQAMRYSVFSGGKRLRPILCLASAEALGKSDEPAMLPAIALECLHTYTLIHDDLPALDNDDLRRGRPTVHRAFGEATAILAGDALLTFAFELLAGASPPPPYSAAQLVRELAEAAGSRGLVGGQFDDLAAEGQPPEAERVASIHLRKTARLFEAACRLGGLSAGAAPEILDVLGQYGRSLGAAFQIADDVLNATSTPEELGKAAGSDAARRKMTYVSVFGVEGARREAERCAAEAVAALEKLACPSAPLAALARFAVARRF